MTLAIPQAQIGLPCPHRWLLGDSGAVVSAKCAYCELERSFLGSWDEEREQSRRYGPQVLRGAAKRSKRA
jgi:hypothetical protein